MRKGTNKRNGLLAKVLGICLALMMVIGLTMPAWAAEGDGITENSTGTITVTADESGWTADAYKVINVNFDFTNQQPIEPAYQWDDKVAEWVGTNHPAYIGEDNAVTEAFLNLEPAQLKEFADKMSAKIAAGEFEGLTVAGSVIAEQEKVQEKVKGTITNLPMGGYMILLKGGNKIYSPVFSHIYPEYKDDRWQIVNGEIEIVAKGTNPTITKAVKNAEGTEITTVAIGDVVTYELQIDIPVYPDNANVKTFVFGDRLPVGVELKKDSIEIKALKENGNDLKSWFDGGVTTDSQNTFEYALKADEEKNYSSLKTEAEGATKIVVTYDATVVSSAYVGADSLINTAYLKYNSASYNTIPTVKQATDECQLYTYGVKIVKEDDSETPLQGAQFTLKKDGTEEAIAFVKDKEKNIYYPAEAGAKPTTTTLESDENGELLIAGLDLGTYTLTETKAPSGYSLPRNPETTITLAEDTSEGKVVDGSLENSGATGTNVKTDSVKVIAKTAWQLNFSLTNSKSNFNLPITGGVGTAIFTIGGMMLMAGAVMLLTYAVRRSRR